MFVNLRTGCESSRWTLDRISLHKSFQRDIPERPKQILHYNVAPYRPYGDVPLIVQFGGT